MDREMRERAELRRELSRVKVALLEAIEVLEETKSSFKSRRLEVLRKRLTAVLAGD